jgi:hypothetical protein
MMDELDKSTTDGPAPPEEQAAKAAAPRKARRLSRQSCYRPPDGAKPEDPANPIGNMRSVVPVSAVARDWGISARRVRKMLEEGRLAGRQLENRYWEVFYPYRYVLGTRGPAIKRQRNLPPARKKPEPKGDWWR